MKAGQALLGLWLLAGPASAQGAGEAVFQTLVAPDGRISLSGADYRNDYVFLGSWAVTDGEDVVELHQVYTQPETIAAYLETGDFPDGAVFIKELQEAEMGDYTTGRVGHFGAPNGWFVMIRDRQGRFPTNPLWGDGWGWAQFSADDPAAPFTESYADECIACHEPARDTGLIYVEGYPLFRRGGH